MKTKTLAGAIIVTAFLLLMTTIFGGCGENSVSSNNNSSGNGSDNVSLSIKADNSALDPLGIVITEAKALINEVEVEQEPSGQDKEIRISPFVVHFNMNGALITITSGMIPSGNYNKIKFKIHKPEDNETPPDPEFKEGSSGNLRYSFIIKGTFNGNNFVYKSRKSASLVVTFPSPINFQELQRNITVLVNPSLWFRSGNVELDPGDPYNESIIDDNLKNSFRQAFKDDNKDGLPDD